MNAEKIVNITDSKQEKIPIERDAILKLLQEIPGGHC